MLGAVIGPEVCRENDDIVSELCSSSREASVNFVPFAHFDLWDLARKVAPWQTEHSGTS